MFLRETFPSRCRIAICSIKSAVLAKRTAENIGGIGRKSMLNPNSTKTSPKTLASTRILPFHTNPRFFAYSRNKTNGKRKRKITKRAVETTHGTENAIPENMVKIVRKIVSAFKTRIATSRFGNKMRTSAKSTKNATKKSENSTQENISEICSNNTNFPHTNAQNVREKNAILYFRLSSNSEIYARRKEKTNKTVGKNENPREYANKNTNERIVVLSNNLNPIGFVKNKGNLFTIFYFAFNYFIG